MAQQQKLPEDTEDTKESAKGKVDISTPPEILTPPEIPTHEPTTGPTAAEKARLEQWRRDMAAKLPEPAGDVSTPSYAGLDPEQARLAQWRHGMKRQRDREKREESR